jgi:hypothetical protein
MVARRVSLALIVLLLCAAASAGPAHAGTYTAYSCHTPSGHTAPTDGWSEELFAPLKTIDEPEPDLPTSSCGSGDGLATSLGGNYSWKPGDRASLRYDAPQGTTIAAFRATACGVANVLATGISVTWPTPDYASPAGFRAQYTSTTGYLGCGNALVATNISTTQVWFSTTCLGGVSCFNDDGVDHPQGVSAAGIDAGSVNAAPACAPYPVCRTVGTVSVSALTTTLHDGAAPVVSSVAGALTTGGLHTGDESATFDASDTASGVYRVVAEARMAGQGAWQTLSSRVVDANGGRCVDAGEDASDDYEFTTSMPCKQVVSHASVAVDTTQLPPGDNLLHVYVEDASGNRTDVVPVRNFSVLGRQDANSSSGPLALVASNGTHASRTASVKLLGRDKRRIRYGRLVKIRGRLLDQQSRPIAGATLQLVQRSFIPERGPTDTAWKTLRNVTTDKHGRFDARVPAKVSRSVLVIYKANTADTGWTSTAQVDLVVSAGVQLKVRHDHVRNHHIAVFVGHVASAPRSGVIVTLQVLYGSEWIPVPTLEPITHTDAQGNFVAKYRFRRTPYAATFRFRALANRDSAFAYAPGRSNVIDVRVRP